MPPRKKAAPKPKDQPEPAGTKLVRCHVAFYQGLQAGAVGEVPTKLADQMIDRGLADDLSSLRARMAR